MSNADSINRAYALETISDYLPLFSRLNERGIDYCLVGGLAVMVRALLYGEDSLRATFDADILVDATYGNQEFANDYLSVYASTPEASRAVYDALFGPGEYDLLSDEDRAFVNMSFVGASEELDGIDTPDFDVCRTLTGRTLETVERTLVNIAGTNIWVATVDELLRMKRDTVSLYRVGLADTSRPQDFRDIVTLECIAGSDETQVNNSRKPSPLQRIMGWRRR